MTVLCLYLLARGLDGSSRLWGAVVPVSFVVAIPSFYFAWMVVSGHIRWSRHAKRFACEEAPKILEALEDGRVSVCSVTSDYAIFIEEYEDEGSACIFDLGDGTSLFLRGQEYMPTEKDAPWPALVRTCVDGRLVGIFTGNARVPEVRTVPMGEMPESFLYSDGPMPETVLPGQPHEILTSLGHHAK